jgi:hypothetical protein
LVFGVSVHRTTQTRGKGFLVLFFREEHFFSFPAVALALPTRESGGLNGYPEFSASTSADHPAGFPGAGISAGAAIPAGL